MGSLDSLYPHALKLSDCNAYYVRVGTTVRAANPEELQELFIASGKTTINQVIQRVRESVPAYSQPYRSVLIAPEYLIKNMVQLSKENEIRITNLFSRDLVIGEPTPTQSAIIFRIPSDSANEYFSTVSQEGVIFHRESMHESSFNTGFEPGSIGMHLGRTLTVIKKTMEFAKKLETANYANPCLLKFEAGNIRGAPLILGSFNRSFYRFESDSILNIDRVFN